MQHDDGNFDMKDAEEKVVHTAELAMVVPKAPSFKLKYANELDVQPMWNEFCTWAHDQPGCYCQTHGGELYAVTVHNSSSAGLPSQTFSVLTDFKTGDCSVEYAYSHGKHMTFASLELMNRTLAVASRFHAFVAAIVV